MDIKGLRHSLLTAQDTITSAQLESDRAIAVLSELQNKYVDIEKDDTASKSAYLLYSCSQVSTLLTIVADYVFAAKRKQGEAESEIGVCMTGLQKFDERINDSFFAVIDDWKEIKGNS